MANNYQTEPEVEIIEVAEKQFMPFDFVVHVKTERQARELWRILDGRSSMFGALLQYMQDHNIESP